MKLAAETLSAWAIECLQRSRVSEADAHCLAESLVQTSLWGIDSHGIARLTHYLNRLAHGSVNPAPQIVVTRSGPATAQVAGDRIHRRRRHCRAHPAPKGKTRDQSRRTPLHQGGVGQGL